MPNKNRIKISLCNLISIVFLGVSRGSCSDLQNYNMNLLAHPDLERSDQRLEDFFWTGSGDGPPAPPDPPSPSPVMPATLVKTTTVLATVYLENGLPPQAVTDQSTGDCILNCEPTGYPDSLQPEEALVPGDRRYWLLTVIRGGTPDGLQLRLARLYQKAFLRSVPSLQQERHLGIVKSLDAPTTRKKHDVHSFDVNWTNGKDTPLRFHSIQSSMDINPKMNTKIKFYPINTDVTPDLEMTKTFSMNFSNIFSTITQFAINTSDTETIAQIKTTTLSEVEDMWILATPELLLAKREIVTDKEDQLDEEYSEKMLDIPLEEDTSNSTGVFKREIIKPEQQPPVQVYIQNVTESAETQSVEIVYVVLVGGRAVPAAVAARDMRLVRDAEVASELGFPVTTKAEPYLKAAEGLEGSASSSGARGNEVWAMVVGALAAAVLLLILLALLCRLVRRKKSMSSAALHSYRSELLKQAEINQLKQVHEEKDGRLISVVSPSRSRLAGSVMPVYRAESSSSSSSSSSGVSEVAAALRRRQKRVQRAGNRSGLRLPHKRVGTTDSLLASAGLSETSSVESVRVPTAPATPTSYLSMPSVKSFPRGNAVEPLNRLLEPISVRHLDFDSPVNSPKRKVDSNQPRGQEKREAEDKDQSDVVQRRQMASQLVRLGSMDKDPGVVGPMVWDLHCQRIKEMPKQDPPLSVKNGGNISRMRQKFNDLVDDAFSLFGSPASSPKSREDSNETYTVEHTGNKPSKDEQPELAQARNDNVRLPGSPYTALDTIRGCSAGVRPNTSVTFHQPVYESRRPRTSLPKHPILEKRIPPTRAWDTPSPQTSSMSARPHQPIVNPALVLAEGRLPPGDPALPLISAIKSEIQRVRDANTPHHTQYFGKTLAGRQFQTLAARQKKDLEKR